MERKRIFLTCFVGILILFVMADPALAADEAAKGGYLAGYENSDPRPTSISWWSTIAYLVSLFAIFVFVVGLAYFAARFIGGKFAQQKLGYGGRILSHLPLGPNRSVCVIEMSGRVFMLGVTEHSITLLSEITDPDEIDRLHREDLAFGKMPDMFSQQFGTLAGLVQKVPPLFRK
ncbi:MAG: flagellar biosynthetic protein FliO [Selenomonas ruminantium]|jgi:flagellar protein FliO/FliZ|uniref:Flagellar protein n=1 Tax=Selenomonas ruminantium TaxID=971 RepID=A0A927ZZR8_SELRU|nr:flagellar biosynthetic protein FliO [Selenomonas ruminantium]MBE6085873.1 flagellar biosynthetic protein FliO [Selenomonas ruminantium]